MPIVFNQHYIGTMDYWDPAVADGLAREREVILFKNAGVSSSSGEVPTTFEQMGANAVAFVKALVNLQIDHAYPRSWALVRLREPNMKRIATTPVQLEVSIPCL